MADDQPTLPTSALADLPSWARIAFLLGVPSVIALYLVYFLTGNVSAVLTATLQAATQTSTTLTQHVQRMEQMSDARSGELTELRMLMRSQERYFQLICLRLSKTRDEQRQCVEGR